MKKVTFSHHLFFSVVVFIRVFILAAAMHNAINESQNKNYDRSDPSHDVIVISARKVKEHR
jgi:hypothetical protein